MELMLMRRKLLTKGGILDTSPIILDYDVSYPGSNGAPGGTRGCCITAKYFYSPSENKQTIVYRGTSKMMRVYKNNGQTYMDYWDISSKTTEAKRNIINIGSDALEITLYTSELDNCYAYLLESGQIFFAGKNSIYYGHTNIHELE